MLHDAASRNELDFEPYKKFKYLLGAWAISGKLVMYMQFDFQKSPEDGYVDGLDSTNSCCI